MKWYECVPNFSEGRDLARIERIVAPARSVPGVTVLDVEANADHHRSVVSLAGEGEPLLRAVFGMIEVAMREIDLTQHHGAHPRMGAADVVPFIPLGEATREDAVALARKLAARVWNELKLPVYLYADSAGRPERADLGVVRAGGFEGIRDTVATDPKRRPDLGTAAVHPTAGIVAIGARPILIAYNAYLTTSDGQVARRVAHAIRARDGGLTEVKALGLEISGRGRAQVSMNLTDYRRTPIHRVLDLVRSEARRYGAEVEETEIVGLVPEDALLDAAERSLQLNRFDRSNILERKLAVALDAPSGDGSHRVDLSSLTVAEFARRLADRTPTPGGGSAAALAAALGASLGVMALAYSEPADGPSVAPGPTAAARAGILTARDRCLLRIDEDARAYESVGSSRRALRATPDDPTARAGWGAALRSAAEVPLATARDAAEIARLLEAHRDRIKPALDSDRATAMALLRAAREGALANVAVNLAELDRAGFATDDLRAALTAERDPPP
ncbi:MAG: glutamate formimidoyltransferase [Thermoplasmata archaeon]